MGNARFGYGADKKLLPKVYAGLLSDFVASLRSCLSQPAKRDRWHKAIKRLESDCNFEEMDLGRRLGRRASMPRPGFLRCEKPPLPSLDGGLAPVDELPDPHRGREGAVLHHVFDCPGRDVQALAEGGFVEQLGELLSVA